MTAEQDFHIETRLTSFTSEPFTGSDDFWTTHEEKLLSLFTTVGETFIPPYIFTKAENNFFSDINSSETFGVLLYRKRNQKKSLAGFSYAFPADPNIEYISPGHTAVRFGWTMIHPLDRHQGGWTQMMDIMDAENEKRGYTAMIRRVRTAGDYAKKIEQRYSTDILAAREYEHPNYGPHKGFVILIPKNNK